MGQADGADQRGISGNAIPSRRPALHQPQQSAGRQIERPHAAPRRRNSRQRRRLQHEERGQQDGADLPRALPHAEKQNQRGKRKRRPQRGDIRKSRRYSKPNQRPQRAVGDGRMPLSERKSAKGQIGPAVPPGSRPLAQLGQMRRIVEIPQAAAGQYRPTRRGGKRHQKSRAGKPGFPIISRARIHGSEPVAPRIPTLETEAPARCAGFSPRRISPRPSAG